MPAFFILIELIHFINQKVFNVQKKGHVIIHPLNVYALEIILNFSHYFYNTNLSPTNNIK